MKKTFFSLTLCLLASLCAEAQQLQLKYADFDQWITRDVKESKIIGGATKTLYEVGPAGKWAGSVPYVNQGGSPWANSNVMAKVAGVVKTNTSVYRERRGSGYCARMVSRC